MNNICKRTFGNFLVSASFLTEPSVAECMELCTFVSTFGTVHAWRITTPCRPAVVCARRNKCSTPLPTYLTHVYAEVCAL